MSMRSRTLPTLCFSLSVAVAPLALAEPATRPAATQPAVDLTAAKVLIAGLGGMWTTVHDAMEKQDYTTAEETSGKMLAQRQAIADAARGSALAPLVNMGFDQLNDFHKALVEHQPEKARSLMAGLDEMGRSTMKLLREGN